MSNSRFRRLVNLKKIQHEASNSTKSSGEHIGDYIGSIPSATLSRRGLHDHCWESKGETREKYCELLPQIKTFLETCLKVTSSSDIVMSFYMIGPNPMNASPTVTLISEDTSSRQSAKKLLKKSEILSHNGFKVISLSRDPGVQRMKRLASGDAEHSFLPRETKKSYLTGKVVHQVLQDTSRMEYDTVPKSTFSAVLGTATEVFINPSQPFNSSSTLIYVRHGATFRPATAFPMSVGSKIYLRTVQHAFMQGSTSSEEYVSDLAECGDIDVDYDSDEDLDGLDDVDVAMTSIGSQSPDNWSDSGSDTDSSFKSQPTSGRSTPCFDQNAFQESDSMVQGLRLASADLAAFESGVRNFSLTKIAQPDKRELVSVGKLIDSSVDLDCALIEATSDYLKAQLNQALDEASGTVARKPQESTAIVAYTSSRGSLNGLISATPSLLRLPGARQLQAVYTIRLDGPLADGDCGSAVRDQRSKSLYGHIVSGCPTTGTAYVLAAHQVQSYVNRISAHLDVRAFNVEEDQTQPYYPRSVVSSASQHAEQLTCVGFGRQPTIWQEARATSIAPKYFPPITIEGIKFVDSAISANNPSAKNWQLDESDLSSVNTKELEQHVESSFVAEKNYGSSSSLSIIDTAKILICVVRIIYKESKKGPSDDRQRLVHSRLLSDMIRMLNVGSDIDVESLSLELLEIDKASGNDSDTSLYRHLFNRARRWSWIIRVLASILALSPTIGFILTRVLAYIHFATLVYLTILGLLVNAGIPTRRYDIVGESNQGLDPGKSFGIKSLDIAILMLAGIENTSEMTALFPTKVTRSKNRGNNQILMTIRNRYKLPAKHNQNVSSRRVLFLLGQAILCLLPIIPGLFLGYVGFFTPRDRERRPVISLLCDAWSFGTVLCCINVTFLGFQTIHWVFQNAPFRGRLSRREKLGIFHAFVTHACGVLHSLTKLGSRIVVVATMQSMSSITTSTLPYGASDRKIPEGLNGNSLYQSFDLVVFLIATEIIFYSDFARRMSALSKLGIIAFTTAVLSFQWCFWGYFSFSDASIALLTGSMFATSSVNGSHIVMWAASFTQMLLAFLVSTATVRSLMRARRYILLGILLGLLSTVALVGQPIHPSASPYFFIGNVALIRVLTIFNVAITLLTRSRFKAAVRLRNLQFREESRNIKVADASIGSLHSHRMRRLTTARKISLFSLSTVIAIGISMGSSALLIKESEKWKRVSTVEMSSRQSSIDWQDRALVLWDGEIHDPLLSPPQQLNRCDGDGFSTSEYWTAIPHEIAPVGFLPTFPLLREGRISSLIPQGPITHAPSMLRTECANIAIPPPQTVPRLVFQSRVLSAEGPQTDSSFTKQCQIRPTLNLNKGFHHCPHSLRKKDVQFGLSELSIDYEKSLGESEDSCSRSELPTSRSQANPKEDEGVNWDSTNLGPSLADRSRTAHPDSEHRQHPPEECTRSNQNTSQLAATPPDEWQHSRKVLYLMYFLDSKNVLEDFRNRDPHQEWLDSRPKAARLIQDNLDSTHLPIAPHQSFGSEYHTFAPKVYKPGERLYGAEMETFRKVQRNENRVLHYFTWSQREKGLYRLESSPCPVDGYENSHFNLETSWNQFICWHLTGQDVCETDISGQHVCYCPKLMRQLLNPFPPNGAFQEILSTTLKHDPASTKPYLELDIRVHLTWCLVPSRIATSYPRFTLPDVAVQILIYRDGLSLVIPPIVMSLRKAIREMEENGHPITLYEDEIMMLCLSADPMIPCLDIFTSAAFRNSGDCGDTDSIFECHVPPTKTLHSPDPRQDSSWEEHSASEKQIPTDCRKDRCAGAQ